ncbi:MAG: hypothetical protein EOP61_04375 [Sphingomonadales bacterium]|nr:MAG: hypothetical protein EOP61_04375 [Sphingomonadales bacterium]
MRIARAFKIGVAGIATLLAGSAIGARDEQQRRPIVLERQGSFEAGGRILTEGTKSLSCDHGHVEYQIPVRPRSTALFLWHSSSAAVWERRWDGGEGYRDIFLRRGFPTYIWDGPRVGRANYGCEDYAYRAVPGRDEGNFTAWRFGSAPGQWFAGVQFPAGDASALRQAMRARYEEFDTVANARLESDAAAQALERVGRSVLVTNSAGGLRAMLTAIKSDKVAAIVAYENPDFVLPESENRGVAPGPYGPAYVSDADFQKLTRFPIQLVWGDNIDKSASWSAAYRRSEAFVRLVNARGGKAELLHLPARGLRGNTHIPFADLNNRAVADLLAEFLRANGLDRRAAR